MVKNSIINNALANLGISLEELRKYSDFYNSDYGAYGNEVYEDVKVRLVHLENFLKENWWNNRFYFLWRDFTKYKQIIDIGFSVPYLPIHLSSIGRLNELPNMVLVDGNDTSKKLALIILDELSAKAEFVIGDALNKNTWNEIKNYTIESKKLFTAFETIEHFDKPDLFWSEIGNFRGSDLMLSLPIGKKIPSHYTVFDNEETVTKYLNQYLDIKESKTFSSDDSNYKIYTAVGSIK